MFEVGMGYISNNGGTVLARIYATNEVKNISLRGVASQKAK
jgi:hypothetical protein